MAKPRVSYYAHHFGTGHLRHAQKIAATRAFDLQVTSTGPRNHTLLPGPLDYVSLTPDVGINGPWGSPVLGDYLHYAPVGEGIRQRFTALNLAWAEFNPDMVMVDVSVEVALFARLSGYPVAFRRMPGERRDRAHQMAYSLADVLFAYYPEGLEEETHLHEFGAKSHYLGISTPHGFTANLRCGNPRMEERPRVVVQTSLASSIQLHDVARAARETPGWDWEVVGSVDSAAMLPPKNMILHGIVPDPAPIMREANLIISSAGHNAVAAAAACRRPVLLVPEERPHDEQMSFVRALQTRAGVPMVASWKSPVDWSGVLGHAALGDPEALAKALFVPAEDFVQGIRELFDACLESANPGLLR